MSTTPALLQTIPQGVDYIRILPELVLSAFGGGFTWGATLVKWGF